MYIYLATTFQGMLLCGSLSTEQIAAEMEERERKEIATRL